jgi:hypothetical protein
MGESTGHAAREPPIHHIPMVVLRPPRNIPHPHIHFAQHPCVCTTRRCSTRLIAVRSYVPAPLCGVLRLRTSVPPLSSKHLVATVSNEPRIPSPICARSRVGWVCAWKCLACAMSRTLSPAILYTHDARTVSCLPSCDTQISSVAVARDADSEVFSSFRREAASCLPTFCRDAQRAPPPPSERPAFESQNQRHARGAGGSCRCARMIVDGLNCQKALHEVIALGRGRRRVEFL